MTSGSRSLPELTAVIPLFNGAQSITTTIDSVLAQTFTPVEVIVVNDGSTDGGPALLERHLERTAATSSTPTRPIPVRVVHQANGGVGAARNRGLSEATTEWVALLDADDVWSPHHLAEIATLIAEQPSAHLVSSEFVESPSATAPPDTDQPTQRGLIDYFHVAATSIGVVHSSTVAMRRGTALDLGGFGAWRAGEDLQMWAQLALHHPVAHSSRVTATYFRHDRSAMAAALQHVMQEREVVSCLGDLSPSAATVSAALDSGVHSVNVDSLKRYLNGRLASSIRQELVRGDAQAAKHLASLALRPHKDPLITCVRAAPQPLLAKAAALRLRRARLTRSA